MSYFFLTSSSLTFFFYSASLSPFSFFDILILAFDKVQSSLFLLPSFSLKTFHGILMGLDMNKPSSLSLCSSFSTDCWAASLELTTVRFKFKMRGGHKVVEEILHTQAYTLALSLITY